jgi:hypothetical protein
MIREIARFRATGEASALSCGNRTIFGFGVDPAPFDRINKRDGEREREKERERGSERKKGTEKVVRR